MGSRSRNALRGRRTIIKACDLGPEHVGKFISLRWDWEWEDFSEDIEGILVSAQRLDTYYHLVQIATDPENPDFTQGYGMWSQDVTVSKTIPQEFHSVAHKVTHKDK